MALRAVYLDLDGTLLGHGGSLLHDGDGAFSLLGARALEACARAGAQVVLCSGRRRSLLEEDARLLGVTDYVFEAGAGFVLDGEVTWLTEERQASVEASGAAELLLDVVGPGLSRDLGPPGREVSVLFRGTADPAAADALLAERGHGHLRLLDNGAALHLLPRDVSKARAVAAHLRARGWAPEEAIAVGDSAEDLAIAPAVGTFWLVGNAAPLPLPPNARRAEAGFGAGVYEAVLTTLAER
jgi:phosphoglycolate phosphatase